MSRIPDCRTDENYNEKYLNETDSEFVTGYDFSIQDNIENFFNNIDNYEDDIVYAMETAGGTSTDISIGVISSDIDIDECSEKEIQKMNPITALLVTLKQRMLEWAEMNRDELLTSMIENMDDSEYEKLKKKADAGKYKNAIVRQAEYKAKYDAGEIPTCWEYKIDENGNTIKIGHCPNGNTITEEIQKEKRS